MTIPSPSQTGCNFWKRLMNLNNIERKCWKKRHSRWNFQFPYRSPCIDDIHSIVPHFARLYHGFGCVQSGGARWKPLRLRRTPPEPHPSSTWGSKIFLLCPYQSLHRFLGTIHIYFTHSTNRRLCRVLKHAFALANIPPNTSMTVTSGLENFQTRSFIQCTLFYAGKSKWLFLRLYWIMTITIFSCNKLFIWFISLTRNKLIAGPSQWLWFSRCGRTSSTKIPSSRSVPLYRPHSYDGPSQ